MFNLPPATVALAPDAVLESPPATVVTPPQAIFL